MSIDGTHLIQNHESVSFLEAAGDPEGVGVPSGRHRRHEDGAEMPIQLIRRQDEAGAGLLDFPPSRGI